MIERFLSVVTGALVTFLALIILDPTTGGDPNGDYLTAVVIGGLASLDSCSAVLDAPTPAEQDG